MKNGRFIRRLLIALLSFALVVQCVVIFGSEKRSFLTFAEEPVDPEDARFAAERIQTAEDPVTPQMTPALPDQTAAAPEEKPAERTAEAHPTDSAEERKAPENAASYTETALKHEAENENTAAPDIDVPEEPQHKTAAEENEPKTDVAPGPEGMETPAPQPASEETPAEDIKVGEETAARDTVPEKTVSPIEKERTESPENPPSVPDEAADASDSGQTEPSVSVPLTVSLNTNRDYAFKGRDAVDCMVETGGSDMQRRLRLIASTAAGEKTVGECVLGQGESTAVFEYVPDITGNQILTAYAETVSVGEDGTERKQSAEASVPLAVPEYSKENDWAWKEKIAALELNGDWKHDLLTVAESQLGQKESDTNYILVDGRKKGSTRYGVWAGDEYGDWCATFVSFCLANAKIPKAGVPRSTGCSRLMSAVRRSGALEGPEYTPAPGDLVFLRKNDSEYAADHMGIVKSGTGGSLVTVEGNTSNDRVETVSRDLNNADAPSRVVGYANVSKLEERYAAAEAAEISSDSAEHTDKEQRKTRFIEDEAEGSVSEASEELSADGEQAEGEERKTRIIEDSEDGVDSEADTGEAVSEVTEELPADGEQADEEERETDVMVQRTLVCEQEGLPRVEVSGLLPENVMLKVTVLPKDGTDGKVGSAYNILSALDITVVDENGGEYGFVSPLTVQLDLGETGGTGGPIGVWQTAGEAAGSEQAVRMNSEDRGNGRIVFTIQPTAA